jgi:hypothetical protein
MVDLDDVFNLIGKVTVVVICLLALVIVLFTVTGHMGVFDTLVEKLVPTPSPVVIVPPTPTPDPLAGLRNDALNNYNYQLELVDEQTQRLDTYYAAKAGVDMSQSEFQSWLQVMNAQTEDFISREENATSSGVTYLNYLELNSSEYNRVMMNDNVSLSDTNKEISNYNNNVAIYNQHWGQRYGYVDNLSSDITL